MEKRSALVFGASGLVGYELIKLLLENSNYKDVTAIVRPSLDIQNPKLNQVVSDFEKLEEHVNSFAVQDVYCCLGTTIKKAKSKEAFRKIDFGFIEKIASLAAKKNTDNISVISSIGADKNSNNFYLKTKGEMEESLKSFSFKSINIFRPSILLGKRKEKRLGERIAKIAIKMFSFLLIGKFRKYRGIEAIKVAQFMISVSLRNNTGINIFESDIINKELSE